MSLEGNVIQEPIPSEKELEMLRSKYQLLELRVNEIMSELLEILEQEEKESKDSTEKK